jgi:hypothetical protein
MMTPEQQTRLERMSMVNRSVTFRHKDWSGHRLMGTVEDEVYVMVSDYKHMIQRIRFAADVSWDGSTHAYRTGYYTYDAGMKHIKWGQFTQFLTEAEYRDLLGKARAKGWDIFV